MTNSPTSDLALLLRLADSVPQLSMCAAAIAERIDAMEPDRAADLLGALLPMTQSSDPGARSAWLAIAFATATRMRDGSPPPLRRLEPYTDDTGDSPLSLLTADLPPHRCLHPGGRLNEVSASARTTPTEFRAFEVQVPDSAPPVYRSETIPIPRRRNMLNNWHDIDNLLRHPDPVMIARLLETSWFTLRDALMIASRRPTTPEITLTLAADPKWFAHIELRKSVALNPYTPTPLSLAILPTLQRPMLFEIIHAESTSPDVVEMARALIALGSTTSLTEGSP